MKEMKEMKEEINLKNPLLVNIDKAVILKLKTMSYKLEKTQPQIIEEAINFFFEKHKEEIIDDLIE